MPVPPEKREINADRQDPGDPNFIYIGKLIAIRNPVFTNDISWSRIYLPTKECLEWDQPPSDINIAIGNRFGFTYAKLSMSGKEPVRVPGGGHAIGSKAKLVRYSFNFNRGWEAERWAPSWVVIPRA